MPLEASLSLPNPWQAVLYPGGLNMRHKPGNDGAKTFFPIAEPRMTLLQTGTMCFVPAIPDNDARALVEGCPQRRSISPRMRIR